MRNLWLRLIAAVLTAATFFFAGWIVSSNATPAGEDPEGSNDVLEVDIPLRFGDVNRTIVLPVVVGEGGSRRFERPAEQITAEFREGPYVPIEGDVIVEVEGRPVFLMLNEFPLYREFGFGSEGPDVLSIQEFLNRREVGEAIEVDGVYGRETGDALLDFFSQSGYPLRPNPAEVAAAHANHLRLRTTREDLAQQLRSFEEALDEANSESPRVS